jgi:choline dehydrogenase
MGIDETSVADPELRIPGIANLRVGDASIMPSVTTGNANAPSVLIGEMAARVILGRQATAAA